MRLQPASSQVNAKADSFTLPEAPELTLNGGKVLCIHFSRLLAHTMPVSFTRLRSAQLFLAEFFGGLAEGAAVLWNRLYGFTGSESYRGARCHKPNDLPIFILALTRLLF